MITEHKMVAKTRVWQLAALETCDDSNIEIRIFSYVRKNITVMFILQLSKYIVFINNTCYSLSISNYIINCFIFIVHICAKVKFIKLLFIFIFTLY